MKLVSVDLGAQSGRVAVGSFDGRRLTVSEVHRFVNVPVRIHGRLHWDALRLYDGILEGMRAAARQGGGFASIAVDGWGIDFALLDRAGRLLQNPVHYRDRRTERAFDEVRELVPPWEIFQATGNQLLSINTIYQLRAMAADQDPVLDVAEKLLLMPDLFNYWLSGVPRCELTGATTTQCYDPVAGDWAWDLVGRLGLPTHFLAEVVPPGTILGPLRADEADETGLGGVSVISPASHDTASAVAAVPFRQPGSAYISSGTWSIVGMEVPRPLIDEHIFAANLTNEAGAGGMFQLLSNCTGLWLLQECRRMWELHGQRWQFTELVALAESAPPLGPLVNPNDPVFLAPGDMPERIAAWCCQSGQSAPDDLAAMVRCVLESLALSYRQTIDLLMTACGVSLTAIHIVGGGARNELLCQLTADATDLPVWAGPIEASQVGNLLVQAMALGELSSLEDARAVVAASFSPVLYEPHQRALWDHAYQRFRLLCQDRPGT